MSANALKSAVTGAVVAEKPKDIFGFLKTYQGEIARALPRHMTADRMARIVTTEIRRNQTLLKCTPVSLFGSVISASQLGLEPGLNGRGFLVPYYNKRATPPAYECQFIPGWKGMVELANRTGRASCWTGAVFAGDQFEYQLGDSPSCRHVPMGEDDPAKLTHVYAVGRVRGGEWPIIEVWPIEKVRKHRDRYNRQGDAHYSFHEWEMYARKIPLLQVLKYLPSSPELEAAMVLSEAAEMGGQGLTIEGVMGSDYAPPPDDDTGETGGQSGAGEHVDPPKASPPADAAPTFAQVVDAIHGAKDSDALDLAADMIRGVADERQRAELDTEARKRRKELAK